MKKKIHFPKMGYELDSHQPLSCCGREIMSIDAVEFTVNWKDVTCRSCWKNEGFKMHRHAFLAGRKSGKTLKNIAAMRRRIHEAKN